MKTNLSLLVCVLVAASACNSPSSQVKAAIEAQDPTAQRRLPTGAHLDPAGVSYDLGSMPLGMVVSPEKNRVVVLLNGWRQQGIQVVERSSGQILQTIPLPAVFLGIVFSPDGKSLYVSGGNEDAIYRFDWRDGAASFGDTIRLAVKEKDKDATHYPSGIAISPDGATLYVAENLADSLAVVDLRSKRVLRRIATDRYPYGVVASSRSVYVSAWGDWTVSAFSRNADGGLGGGSRIRVGRHPSAMALSPDARHLFVASSSTDKIVILSTSSNTVIGTIDDSNPAETHEGSTPNAFAISADGSRLFVAEADNNAVAIFDIGLLKQAGIASSPAFQLLGRIPVGWYPSGVSVDGNDLLVLNAKGRGTAPNPGFRQTGKPSIPQSPDYTLGQINGTLTIVPAISSIPDLQNLSARVATANGWNATRRTDAYPRFEHVIYIIKENRTYDQVFGDLPQADGDSSLLFFPRSVSPNHHALAERFGIFDRFFVNAEVSPHGHNWSMGAYVSDYAEKTIPSHYSDRGRTYDYEGTNRGEIPADDAAEGGNGYLWNLVERAGISYRNYGEFVQHPADEGSAPKQYIGTKPFLAARTNTRYPGFDMGITDQHRVDIWMEDFQQFVRSGSMPKLQTMRLPSDHTSGASAGKPTPRAYMADNDLALGRIVEAVSKSPFWKNTVIVVLEDDAQDGPDHVDSHRSVLLVISAYNRGRV
ncbi:MAG TPA: beta-propeller fold lactonase family protein, partial [Gemmatimonadaceae bacterium]|nr:beta-propeller fold lactonase family protein [Gemmatimonadaceae bacterium]